MVGVNAKHNGKFVAYYRVSTARQGQSGLGLEAQQRAVTEYLNGGQWKLIAEITEIESGKRSDRPKLAEALALCRVHGATLIIAKLDRLARNVAFVSALMDAGIDFEAVDFPQANRLTIHIMAAVAEHEAKAISERTKAALAAAKARGVKLGGYRVGAKLTADDSKAGRDARTRIATQRATDIAPTIQAAGAKSLGAIAAGLNAKGIPTARGNGTWSAVQVSRVMSRLP